MQTDKSTQAGERTQNLVDSKSYRCSVNAKGQTSSVTLTGLCIRLTRDKTYSYAADMPLIAVHGPAGEADFARDESVPF